LVAFWQFVPFGEVDEVVALAAAFPPTRIVVVLRDLVEPELLVVVRPNPFAGVERAFLQRWIDVAGGELLGHRPELGEDGAGKSADAHLKALQIVDGLDLLAKPAAHLSAGIGRCHPGAVEVLQQIVQELGAPPKRSQEFIWRAFNPNGSAVPKVKAGSLPQ